MRRRNSKLPVGQTCRLYKNNTDFQGHSYGCHDNYLMRREVQWDRIVTAIVPFLVTRQIFAGAGKMGIEGEEERGDPGVFQLAQRSDFFEVQGRLRLDHRIIEERSLVERRGLQIVALQRERVSLTLPGNTP